jgi:hypothetical protein
MLFFLIFQNELIIITRKQAPERARHNGEEAGLLQQ